VARIENVVVLVANKFAYRPLYVMRTTKTTAADRLNLYNWFPFKFGGCGEIKDIILLDEWVFENKSKISENAHLYPAKVPKYFMGCPIKFGTIGIDPYFIMTENDTQIFGSNAYKMTGFWIEIFNLVFEKIKLTNMFLPLSLNI
jgi:hypothetical protein